LIIETEFTMKGKAVILFLFLLLGACAEEAPPTSVEDFIADRVLLDATLARCDLGKSDTFDDRNCVNARRAVERLWRQQEELNATLLEQDSERKRELLRQQHDQEALLEEQRRLAEEQRQQEELYQGTDFDSSPAPDPQSQDLPKDLPAEEDKPEKQ
jgi:membrane protein involved in colicin uptake